MPIRERPTSREPLHSTPIPKPDRALGYNTNGLAHHDLFDAVKLLARIGYRGVAITVDHGVLASDRPETPEQVARLRELLNRFGMRSVVETGARFLLDPEHKHEPTLVSPCEGDRRRRVAFYRHCIDLAAELSSDCVSIWSGVVQDACPRDEAMDRLTAGLAEVMEYAAERGVVVGFEPEPGMLIDSMARFRELLRRLKGVDLGLTLDVGHLHCQGEVPVADFIRDWADRIVNVHIEDMRAGVHEHLMFGHGEIEFAPILDALADVGYSGGVYVELSRHSHMGPTAARQALDFLKPLMKEQ